MTDLDLLASAQVYEAAIAETRAEIAKTPAHMTTWLESRERMLREYQELHRAAVDGLAGLGMRTAA